MDAQSEGGGSPSPRCSQSSVQSSASATTLGTPSTSPATTGCQQTQLNEDFNQLAAYLAKEKAPKGLHNALQRIRDACERVAKQSTTDAIHSLQEAVQKLTVQIEAKPTGLHATGPLGTSYAAAAQRGATVELQSRTQSRIEPTKPVPVRHKREIIVTRGKETLEKAQRTGKEVIEQLNSVGIGGQIVAARRLPSGDMVLTTDDEQTRTKWLVDHKWLAVFGVGARVKRREFVVLAHGIRVAQVQESAQAVKDIYRQNPKLQGSVEVLRVAWAKKLLRAGRKTGPLHISVAEPEQANTLIQSGLVWDYQLHDCEPFTGECQVTQCFNCYQYGHVARMCRDTPRCGFCAALGHATNDCLSKEDRTKHRCVPCGTTTAKHSSWDQSCPIRTKQVESAKLAYSTRPSLFQEHLARQAAATAQITTITPTPTETASNNSSTVLEPKGRAEPEPQAKRPRGRPRKIPNVPTTTAPTTTTLTPTPAEIASGNSCTTLRTVEPQIIRPGDRPQGSTNTASKNVASTQ
jgi:hypothetical protein